MGLAAIIAAWAGVGCGDDEPVGAEGPDQGAADVTAGGDADASDAGPADGGPDALEPHPGALMVLSYNVGNGDGTDPNYPYRMRDQAYEDHVGAQIRAVGAQIVALQEVLPTHYCEAFEESDPDKTCYQHASRGEVAKRLLGADYSVVCDDRLQFECLGVHRDFGALEGVDLGEMVTEGAPTEALPLPPCSYVDNSCTEELCDAEATVSSARVQAAWGELRLIHLHLNATGQDAEGNFYLGTKCREGQFQQVIDMLAAEPDTPTVVLGDFNFDPDQLFYEAEGALWATVVGEGLPLTDHGERDGEGVRVSTIAGLGVAIDHVLTTFAEGTCEVQSSPTLDAGFDFEPLGGQRYPGRIDHRALICDLSWPTER